MEQFLIAVGAAVLAGVILLIIPRTRPWLVAAWRWVTSLRVTTTTSMDARTEREIESRRNRVVQPRWVLTAVPSANAEVTIRNTGGPARSVHVETAWHFLQIVSKGQWTTFDEGAEDTFLVIWQEEYMTGWGRPDVLVTWTDEAGDAHSAQAKINPAGRK